MSIHYETKLQEGFEFKLYFFRNEAILEYLSMDEYRYEIEGKDYKFKLMYYDFTNNELKLVNKIDKCYAKFR